MKQGPSAQTCWTRANVLQNRGFILFQYALFGLLLNKLGVWLAGNFSLSLTTA